MSTGKVILIIGAFLLVVQAGRSGTTGTPPEPAHVTKPQTEAPVKAKEVALAPDQQKVKAIIFNTSALIFAGQLCGNRYEVNSEVKDKIVSFSQSLTSDREYQELRDASMEKISSLSSTSSGVCDFIYSYAGPDGTLGRGFSDTWVMRRK